MARSQKSSLSKRPPNVFLEKPIRIDTIWADEHITRPMIMQVVVDTPFSLFPMESFHDAA
jgi:hypothetical protein